MFEVAGCVVAVTMAVTLAVTFCGHRDIAMRSQEVVESVERFGVQPGGSAKPQISADASVSSSDRTGETSSLASTPTISSALCALGSDAAELVVRMWFQI